ncbi:hypothetical protein HOD05_05385 [Candidatus Woesearchaeota archaeon]|jgi:hypothetical protein|nr:hypothetical protein [Candidatus Woesearchaeota archaeon]MBT4150517.1 hypothetical protein [Candidatus Woesearchaeota archaeon]MBT4247157.1 hypothetical protein [Candidatus Woesearchaeota archaeon]MBT4434617.1 hypothetical protein [Candidatus Woesearchaeota archaeon]MBT7332531.1 hypothetical protein [Candidatus Woesearchaeota archaeon]
MTIKINLQKESLKCFQNRNNKNAFRKLESQSPRGLDKILQIESNISKSEVGQYISGVHTAAIIALEGMETSKEEIVGYTSTCYGLETKFDYYTTHKQPREIVFLNSKDQLVLRA